MVKQAILYCLDTQKKLTAFVVGITALLGGGRVISSDAKFEAYTYAVAGMAAMLMGSHAYQAGKLKIEDEPEDSAK